MQHAQTRATGKDWERTLDLSDELSRDELLVLIPLVQKALSASIEELLVNLGTNAEPTRLAVVLGKLLVRTERRRKQEHF